MCSAASCSLRRR
uniref:Uncharacterized protein n=1 Tax=Anguilla anguilla TaxID=7936 RepID=A0A0E9VMD6_ANGAN